MATKSRTNNPNVTLGGTDFSLCFPTGPCFISDARPLVARASRRAASTFVSMCGGRRQIL